MQLVRLRCTQTAQCMGNGRQLLMFVNVSIHNYMSEFKVCTPSGGGMSRIKIAVKWGVLLVASKGLDLICMDTYQSHLLGITKPHKEVMHFWRHC